jgi:alkylation response protein AidB-like acyl-CoA dehydrogenase
MAGTVYVEGYMQRLYRDARAHTIGGGTSDILRNVIAKRMGL